MMRTVVNIAFLVAFVVAFVVAFAVASPGTVFAEGLDMVRVEELKVEGKKHFDASADVDLPFSDRNKERKAAYDLLTEAFEILDKWCETHPEDAERLEDLKPAVPHLARFMGNPQLRQFTGFVLREITGVNFEYESQVRAWWSQHGSD